MLLCFNSQCRRYKFNRLPFGLSTASEFLQIDFAEIIEGVYDAANAQDDIIIWVETKEIHDQRLHHVMLRIKPSGLQLNRATCKFCVTLIAFFEHVLSSHRRKISAILVCLRLKIKQNCKDFLGV